MAKDELGRALGQMTIPASAKGYQALLAWSRELGTVQAFGVEGTRCYGAGLARYLRREREVVIEVIRPNRSTRRLRGKSDPVDAEAAASAVLSGEARATPKSGEGAVEMIRVLRVARTTAIRARTQAINALHAVVVTSPSELRERLDDLSGPRLVRTCAAFRRVSGRGILRQGHAPPAEPWWEPSGQLGAAPDRDGEAPMAPIRPRWTTWQGGRPRESPSGRSSGA
jgi:transposase